MKIAKQTAKKVLIILLIVFGGLTLLGGSIFTIAMAAAGWDFTVMNTVKYEQYEFTETQTNTSITLLCDTQDIKVLVDEDATKIRVEYAEKFTKNGKQLTDYAIYEEAGNLKIVQKYIHNFYMEFYVGDPVYLYVYLPKNMTYSIYLETDTGDVHFNDDLTLTDLAIKTDTGDVHLRSELSVTNSVKISVTTGDVNIRKPISTKQVNISTSTGDVDISGDVTADSVNIKTTTGDVELGNLTGNTLNVTTSTGDVECEKDTLLDFVNLQFKTTTGDVDICLAGNYTDYSVDVKTSTGDVNLVGYPDSSKSKTLFIRTSTGDIRGIYTTK